MAEKLPGPIFHIGLHKSGTTSLQRHLFRRAGVPYHGVGDDWPQKRKPWHDFLLRDGVLPETGRFIFSDEGILLRAGMHGVEALGRRIANASGARVLVTIREPSALLESAYYQSLELRGSALGYCNGKRSWPPPTTRFQNFKEWYEGQQAEPGISLAGLLDYPHLREALASGLDREPIFLPLEWLSKSPALYVGALVNAGFPADEAHRFVSAPPENAGTDKQLRRLHPLLFRLLGRTRMERSHPLERAMRRPMLGKYLERFLYSGESNMAGAPDPAFLASISARYSQGWAVTLSHAAQWGLLGIRGSEKFGQQF